MPHDPVLRAARNRRYRSSHGTWQSQIRRFIGVDGEGGGTDEYGRQNFLLLRAGNMELFDNNNPLRSRDCIEFLLATPRNAILCGYFFTYDATQILRDLPTERLVKLFEEKPREKGRSTYTFWGEYGIEFRPRQYFRVCRINRDTLKSIPGTVRTVNEVGGFFQKSFVEALRDWNIGDNRTVEMIAANKERRAEFYKLTRIERDYCAAECALLAELMEALRRVCREVDIEPKQWRGAGWIAGRLHEIHKTPKKTERIARPAVLDGIAAAAYYGGRFEVTAVGSIPGPVYEYDVNSAYPAAMPSLPCPIHTRWRKFRDVPGAQATFVAKISFRHSDDVPLCGFPIRRKGHLFWPRQGQGVYWQPEIAAAMMANPDLHIEWHGGYYAQIRCNCRSYEWVRDLYDYRKSLGKAQIGYPIKLGINGLYGKLAQRQGAAPYHDHIAAGLITANCRASLMRAYAQDPAAIVMLATDGIYSRRPLALQLGEGLGEWEAKVRHGGMFVVQPGIYWSPGSDERPKTRGIPRSKIIERRAEFEAAWCSYMMLEGEHAPPIVAVPITSFIGHRLALSWGKPEMAGRWMVIGSDKGGRQISFDWSSKRTGGNSDGQSIITAPKSGYPGLRSETYDPVALSDGEAQNLEMEGAPDWEPWGNSDE